MKKQDETSAERKKDKVATKPYLENQCFAVIQQYENALLIFVEIEIGIHM